MRGPLLRGTPFMAAFALVLLLSSCSGSGHAAATPGATSETTRSIQPSLSTANPSAQTQCPRTTGERVVNPQFGEGPVYAVVPRNEPNVVAFTVTTPGRGPFYPGFSATKILWVVAPSYRGAVTIRGARVDGPGDVKFSPGSGISPDALTIPAFDRQDWQGVPSNEFVDSAGCYALAIEGNGFTETIYIEAVLNQ